MKIYITVMAGESNADVAGKTLATTQQHANKESQHINNARATTHNTPVTA